MACRTTHRCQNSQDHIREYSWLHLCITIGEDSEDFISQCLILLNDCACIRLSGRHLLVFQKVIVLAQWLCGIITWFGSLSSSALCSIQGYPQIQIRFPRAISSQVLTVSKLVIGWTSNHSPLFFEPSLAIFNTFCSPPIPSIAPNLGDRKLYQKPC